jgi:hypothetical protein
LAEYRSWGVLPSHQRVGPPRWPPRTTPHHEPPRCAQLSSASDKAASSAGTS